MQRITALNTNKTCFYCNEIMRLLFFNDLNISLDKSEINTRRGSKLLYHAKTANAHNETESCIIIASTNITISSYNESVYFAFMFL